MPFLFTLPGQRNAPDNIFAMQEVGDYYLDFGQTAYGSLIRLFSLNSAGFQNQGTIWNISPDNVGVAIYGSNSGTINNNGLIVSEAPNGNAYGIAITSRILTKLLINSGSVFAIGGGSATAVEVWEPNLQLNNSGLIAAYAPTGNQAGDGGATGLAMFNGGFLTNAAGGQILAEGLSATALVFSRGELFDPGRPLIVNAGRIEALALGSGRESIAILTGALSVEFMTIVNSGLIRADIAYRSDSKYFSPPNGPREHITNLAGGQIFGRIETDLGDDSVINRGLINGTVLLGAGSDFYDGTGGTQIGAVYGEAGHDVLRGGLGDDQIYGGDGDDFLAGGDGADLLVGGNGADRFQDSAAGLNGDILHLGIGDVIVINDASLATFSFSVSGSTLTYSGGSLIMVGAPGQTLYSSAAIGGGVQLAFAPALPLHDARSDFNGDGRSDVMWRHDGGRMFATLGTPSGGLMVNPAGPMDVVPVAWQIIGTGDFNGDGRDDLLWRHTNGTLSNWLASSNATFTVNDAYAWNFVPTDWQVAGIGDFNGDGRDDILWRSSTGALSDWLGTATGGFTVNDANAFNQIPNEWQIAGVGDFNGDGRDDILWRHADGTISNWLGTATGGFAVNDPNALVYVPNVWLVAGVGDFNGDGRDDILWQRDFTNEVSNWLGSANGGFIVNDVNAYTTAPSFWRVVAIGDYNGDGRDDLLWRSIQGDTSNWLGNANGGFVVNDGNAFTNEPQTWHSQPPTPYWI